MFDKNYEIIKNKLSLIVDNSDLVKIVPYVKNKNTVNHEAVFRILNPTHDVKIPPKKLYAAVIKRGPVVLAKFQDALKESNFNKVAQLLMESEESIAISRRPSLDSLGSRESVNSGESDLDRNIQRLGSPELSFRGRTYFDSESQPFTSSSSSRNATSGNGPSACETEPNLRHVRKPKCRKSVEPYKLSDYQENILPRLQHVDLSFSDVVNIRPEDQQPVKVKTSTEWKDVGHFHYKMNSYPRGCALVVNNMEFEDEKNFPRRNGAENDKRRLMEMLDQFYFKIEYHENKTRMQMNDIVRKFSRKEELNHVDCVLVVFMSHGAEGASEEDTEIIGVDGIGFKTREIVSYFSNDRCKALIHKPKVFFFQACRGVLRDGGVLYEAGPHRMSTRTETDGRKIESRNYPVRVRSTSDVFIAFAVPPGRPANRDIFSGTWFIQTIINVFSEHAWEHDLEDMLKMVDNRIKNLNNLEQGLWNFQAVATATIGWNKKLYFNPGLRKGKVEDEVNEVENTIQSTPGVDVVDNCHETNNPQPQRRPGGNDDEDECSRRSCLPLQRCIVI